MYVCPVGEVHTTVPSKTCPPATGSRWAADTPRPDAEANHYRDSIADTVAVTVRVEASITDTELSP